MPPPCDLLLTNAHVLTMDERFTAHPSGFIAIADGQIVAIGSGATDYQVMPGLVNAHTHAPMTCVSMSG